MIFHFVSSPDLRARIVGATEFRAPFGWRRDPTKVPLKLDECSKTCTQICSETFKELFKCQF